MVIERTFSNFKDLCKSLKALENLDLLYTVYKKQYERTDYLGNQFIETEWLLIIE